jgi:mannosyltransferase
MALDVSEPARSTIAPGGARVAARAAAGARTRLQPSTAAIVGLTALAAAVRFIGLGRQSFWLDESVSVSFMHLSFGQMLTALAHHDGTPPLYATLAWLWTRVFGISAVGLRSLSAVFGTLTVPVAWAVGRRISGRIGLAVAALAACNPMLIWYAQEARCYSLLVLMTSITLLAWSHLRETSSARWAAIWGVSSALAFATHWYAALILAPEVVWLVRRRRHDGAVRLALYGLAVTVLGLLPLMYVQLHAVALTDSWMSRISVLWRLELVPRSFAIGPGAAGAPWLLVTAGLAVAVSGWLALRRVDPTVRRSMWPATGLLLGGLVIVAALALTRPEQLQYRYLLPLWLPAALLVAGGLAGPGAGRAGTIALALLCATGLVAASSVLLDARYQRPDWKGVAAAVGTAHTPPVYLVHGCSAAPLNIYLSGLSGSAPGGVTTTRLDLVSADDQSSMAAVAISHWAETCTPVAHNFIAPYRVGPFVRTGPPVRLGNMRVWRLRSARPVRVTGGELTRLGVPGDLLVRRGRPRGS